MQSASELQGARAVGCRNDVCQTVSLQPLADGLAQGSEVSLDVTEPDPDEGISLDTFAQPTSEGFVLTFLWSFFATSDLHVGDRLSVRISNPDDAELFAGAGRCGPSTTWHGPSAVGRSHQKGATPAVARARCSARCRGLWALAKLG